MSIELNRDDRERATKSLQAYVRDELDVEIGSIAAGGLLDFFMEDIAPAVYNTALRNAQEQLAPRIAELDVSLGKLEFPLSRRTGQGL